MEEPTLGELGNLAEQMNERLALEPEIDTNLEGEELKQFIELNAKLIHERDKIDEHGKATLRKMGIGPKKWLEEKPKKEDQNVAGKKENSAKKKSSKKKGKKSAGSAPSNKAEKEAPENKSASGKKKSAPKKAKGPGVIASIQEIITDKGPINKAGILKILVKKFPDREEESMEKTVNVQIPNRMSKEKGINIEVDDKGRFSVGKGKAKTTAKKKSKKKSKK